MKFTVSSMAQGFVQSSSSRTDVAGVLGLMGDSEFSEVMGEVCPEVEREVSLRELLRDAELGGWTASLGRVGNEPVVIRVLEREETGDRGANGEGGVRTQTRMAGLPMSIPAT